MSSNSPPAAGRRRLGSTWTRKVAPMVLPPPVAPAGKEAVKAAAKPVAKRSTDAPATGARPDAAPEAPAKAPATPPAPLEARTIVVTSACPPQMVSARDGRGPWACAQFQLQRLIGSGKTSNVYQACCIRSGVTVALKMYPKKSLSALNLLQVQREQQIHSRLHHANVLELYAVFEDAEAYYFVMQYVPRGDLFHELKRCGGCFSERRAVRDVIYPTLCALAYMHSENIIHRDVKPENTLVAEDGTAVLADFGLSMDCGLERPATRLGTLDYMAPEVLRCPDKDAHAPPGPQLYDGKVDSWAVGVLAFEVLVGRAPFEQECKQTTCDLICYGDYVMPSFLSAQAKDFISRALCKNAATRPCIAELMAHAWVAGEVRRTSGVDRAAGGGGVGSFLLARVFKDGGGAAAAAPQKPRVDPLAAARSRFAQPPAAPKTQLAAPSGTVPSWSNSRFSPVTPPKTAPRSPAAQPAHPARA